MTIHALKLKRIYEPAEPEDGIRILVDRLWPRGISKDRAALDDWAKVLAPSPELRKDFCHLPERMDSFRTAYAMELDQSEDARLYAARIRRMLNETPVTLLYAAKDPEVNHAVVLKAWLEAWLKAGES